jgi:hypothetical protein
MLNALYNALKYIFKKVTKLSIPYFSLEENYLKFKITSEFSFKFLLSNIETKTRHDAYVLDAYNLKTKDIYIEYIHTINGVIWNSQPFSAFLDLLKDELKTNSFKNIFKKSFSPYEFNIYEVDNVYKLYIIYIYEMNKEIFIVDTKGELYENLLRNFEKSYNCNFEKNENNHFDLNISLVKKNALRNYFKLASS